MLLGVPAADSGKATAAAVVVLFLRRHLSLNRQRRHVRRTMPLRTPLADPFMYRPLVR